MWMGGRLKGGVLVGCVAVWNQSSESIGSFKTGPETEKCLRAGIHRIQERQAKEKKRNKERLKN